jgi:hypothetical protein
MMIGAVSTYEVFIWQRETYEVFGEERPPVLFEKRDRAGLLAWFSIDEPLSLLAAAELSRDQTELWPLIG